ncbi:ribonuclease H-like domain-containing protein [Tanacetum coccineum]
MVRSMRLFKHKFHADRTLSRYKVRLVANGSSQQLGIDFDETFSPVVKLATIRTVLSLDVSRKWPIHQLDVKNAFLNGDLSETVYMYRPPSFVDSRFPNYVCRLQRSLYGLKQAPPARQVSQVSYLLLYVDDIILTASSTALLQQLINSLHREFDMTDLGALNYFLGISVVRHSLVDTESKLGPNKVPVQNPTISTDLPLYAQSVRATFSCSQAYLAICSGSTSEDALSLESSSSDLPLSLKLPLFSDPSLVYELPPGL